MSREITYDSIHFSRVPAPGHGGSIHSRQCQHPECRSGNGAHYGRPGSVEKAGTSAEAVWRESVGLSR